MTTKTITKRVDEWERKFEESRKRKERKALLKKAKHDKQGKND